MTPDESGARFDTFLSQHLDELSRSQAALLIRRGAFAIDDEARKPGYRVRTGESVMGRIPPPVPTDLMPEAIPLQVLFEDHALIVINKPAGLVVHPAAGHPSGTLVNALLHHCPNLEGIGGEKRPGIVHRLDKNTSGLLIVAKNNTAHQDLSRQFKERLIHKQYLALVSGVPPEPSGTIDLPLARHPMERKKMAVSNHSGREAITVWHMREQFPEATLLAITIKTGR
ncbi:MAG: RluA family pseudouridine synthase, partial [Desulfatitalea sp.]|nr:RluA family pseudouridine synthase [Desulfatitalea sp.]